MKDIKSTSLEDFYNEAELFSGKDINALLPSDITKDIGHFNVFDISEI